PPARTWSAIHYPAARPDNPEVLPDPRSLGEGDRECAAECGHAGHQPGDIVTDVAAVEGAKWRDHALCEPGKAARVRNARAVAEQRERRERDGRAERDRGIDVGVERGRIRRGRG